LLASLKLLWAKLPGPRQARGGILFEHTEKKGRIKVFSPDGNINQVFPPQITGVTVQKVKPQADGRYTADGKLLQSNAKVKIRKPDTAELRDLSSEVKGLLLSGSGQIAVVTGIVKGKRFNKQKEIYARGKGRGRWEIVKIVE
jgi:hypothetical protein